MMTVFQLEPTIRRGETVIAAQVCQCRHQPLVDIQRCELVQLLEQVGALRHDLRQQRNGLRGSLANERAELCPTQEECPRFLRRAGIGDVGAVGRQAFASERLARRGNYGNESTSDFDLVPQYDVTLEHDENAVSRRTTLIKLES